jgi:hypothetical protein
MIPIYNSENELSHWVSIQRDTEERNQEKEKRTSDKRINSKTIRT